MPKGLNMSPAMWQSCINFILDCLQNRKYCGAIMDYLSLFTPEKKSHNTKPEDLQKASLKNGLKISIKKCHLFKKDLQYMDNYNFIKRKRLCVKPIRRRREGIQRLKPPTPFKRCKCFAGVVNILSLFCPEKHNLYQNLYMSLQEKRNISLRN